MSPGAPRLVTSWVRMSFIRTSLAAGRGVGQQSHLAGVLDGLGDETLLLDGDTRDPARADLAAVRDELAQKRGVLVIDFGDLGRGERVALLLRLPDYWLCHVAPELDADVCLEGGLVGRAGVAAPGVRPTLCRRRRRPRVALRPAASAAARVAAALAATEVAAAGAARL